MSDSKDLHLDSDLIVYKTCAALGSEGVVKKREEEGQEQHEFSMYIKTAKSMTKSWVLDAKKDFNIRKVYTHLTSKDKSNFRLKIDVDPPYKHNRVGKPLPNYLNELHEWYAKHYKSEVTYGAEADDTIGIICANNPRGTVRISEKDLRMIPGWHKEISGAFGRMPIYVTDPGSLIWKRDSDEKGAKGKLEGWGYKWFIAQMLIGDTADGIAGIKGLGDFAAYKLLFDVHTVDKMDELVYNIYREKGQEDLYEKNRQLLWIHREML